MNLTSPSQVKDWCIRNGFHPNKVLGQNFLIDRNALVSIVDAGLESGLGLVAGGKDEPRTTDCEARVLEIGPGLGVLTEEMLSRGCEVVAIEKDPVLAERLKAALGNPARLTVIAGDALEVIARPSTFNLQLSTFSHMVSNLPYQAGTRILLELVKRHEIPSMTVLVQSEVAERLAASEGSRARGLAGVWAQLDYDVQIVRKVAASCFWPRPAIASSVVRLHRKESNVAISAEERKLYYNITKRAFEHRRKQLGTIFRDLIKSTLRAEELSNVEWVALVKGLMQNEDAGGIS